jgi:hypothetical protein
MSRLPPENYACNTAANNPSPPRLISLVSTFLDFNILSSYLEKTPILALIWICKPLFKPIDRLIIKPPLSKLMSKCTTPTTMRQGIV